MTDNPTIDNALSAISGGRAGSTSAPRRYEDLGAFEKLIAGMFMLLAQSMPDEAQASANADPAGAEPDSEPGLLEQFLASVLGFDLAQNRNAVQDWRQDMERNNWNWRETQDFSIFNFTRAEERIIGRNFSFGNRQEAVMSVMDDAASKAGISKDFMVGLWGIESDFGNNLVSPSGCRGDWQFTQSTFASIINGYGDRIAAHLREAGHNEEAEQVLRAKNTGAGLQSLCDNPYISTYAAAYYVKDVAATLNVDANDSQNWGALYAGYNIGPGNARKLSGSLAHTDNAGSHLGSAARWNPGFFANGETGVEALRNYQGRIIANLERFNSNSLAGQYARATAGESAGTMARADQDQAVTAATQRNTQLTPTSS